MGILDIYYGENTITISELGKAEFISTVFKKYREKEINEEIIEAQLLANLKKI